MLGCGFIPSYKLGAAVHPTLPALGRQRGSRAVGKTWRDLSQRWVWQPRSPASPGAHSPVDGWQFMLSGVRALGLHTELLRLSLALLGLKSSRWTQTCDLPSPQAAKSAGGGVAGLPAPARGLSPCIREPCSLLQTVPRAQLSSQALSLTCFISCHAPPLTSRKIQAKIPNV